MEKQNSKFRWIIFVSVLFTYLLMASQRTAPGLITEQLMRDFSITAATVGLLASIQFFIYTALQVPMGILVDRYGPNFFLISGAILTGIGTIIYSLGIHEYILFFARILTGTGDATIWVCLVLILGQWFNKQEFVRLIGVAGMTGSLGFLMATFPLSLWIDFVGWRGAFFSLGLALSLCSILLYFLLIIKSKQFFKENPRPVEKQKPLEKTGVLILLKRIVTNRQAWALFFCHFGVVGGYLGFISSWAVPYGMNVYEMTMGAASQLAMLGLIGALIGAPLTSLISSRLGSIKRPYVTVHLIVLLTWSSFLFFNAHPPFFILYFMFFIIGYGFGASALTFAVVRQTFPMEEAGLVSGFANTGGFLSAVLLPAIFGFILDAHTASGSMMTGYFYGFLTPVVFSFLGLIGVSSIRERTSEQVSHRQKAD